MTVKAADKDNIIAGIHQDEEMPVNMLLNKLFNSCLEEGRVPYN